MNERIRELAERAGLGQTRWNTTEQFHNFLQEFAELLVKECASYLTFAMEVHGQQDQDLMELAAQQIKQYFGVEE